MEKGPLDFLGAILRSYGHFVKIWNLEIWSEFLFSLKMKNNETLYFM